MVYGHLKDFEKVSRRPATLENQNEPFRGFHYCSYRVPRRFRSRSLVSARPLVSGVRLVNHFLTFAPVYRDGVS
jgi:hypothetical protein